MTACGRHRAQLASHRILLVKFNNGATVRWMYSCMCLVWSREKFRKGVARRSRDRHMIPCGNTGGFLVLGLTQMRSRFARRTSASPCSGIQTATGGKRSRPLRGSRRCDKFCALGCHEAVWCGQICDALEQLVGAGAAEEEYERMNFEGSGWVGREVHGPTCPHMHPGWARVCWCTGLSQSAQVYRYWEEDGGWLRAQVLLYNG